MVDINYLDKIKLVPELTTRQYNNFWKKVKISTNEKLCWEWSACLDIYGYGAFALRVNGIKSMHKAHRVSFFIKYGQIKYGHIICHSCDNTKCVNPNHLFEGTHKDNSIDRENKGRLIHGIGETHWTRQKPWLIKRGERHLNSKITNKIALKISKEGSKMIENNVSKMVVYYQLASKFNISETMVRRIIKKQRWVNI